VVAAFGSGGSRLHSIPYHEEKEIRAEHCSLNYCVIYCSFCPEITPDSSNISFRSDYAYAFKAFSDK
jgi:hypothetical protein